MVKRLISKLQATPHLLILAVIIIIALFFRTYKIVDWFDFAHDGDLYSWIVKDIIVDHHIRLIGQLTSAPGIFIGPAFYYILIPFFLVFRMDPVGALIPVTIIGILTVLSYYLVFSKLFNKEVGLISSFLYATLLSMVTFDRRIVPSTPTNIWLVWYFYSVIMLARGSYNVLPLTSFLVGLIWHIHIALIPALLAVPVALGLAKKIPTKKQITSSAIAFTIPSLPLILFEVRHGFPQTLGFVSNLLIEHGGGKGIEKLEILIIKFADEINRLFFYPQGVPINKIAFVILVIFSAVFIFKKKLLSGKELIIFYSWIVGVFLFYTFSSTIVSEYYFANIEIIFLTIVSLFLYFVYRSSTLGKYLTFFVLALILVKNVHYFVNLEPYKKGYNERKAVALFITEDSKNKNFPCVSISYITSPGENVGFRYFFWLNNLNIIKVQKDSVTYSIVNPPEFANGKQEKYFGQIKVIIPDEIPTKEKIQKSCGSENTNLTDPLFGFTK